MGVQGSLFFFLGWDTNEVAVDRLPLARWDRRPIIKLDPSDRLVLYDTARVMARAGRGHHGVGSE